MKQASSFWRLKEIWKMTSIFLKMEDNLIFLKEDNLNLFENGRRPETNDATKNK
jgi:hypothetical protein